MSHTAEIAAPGAAKSRRPVNRRLIGGLLLPLFFAIVFPLVFTSATHAPEPHALPLTVVGPQQVVGKIADALDSSDSFSVTETDVSAEARASVEERRADGAIEVAVAAPVSDAASPAPAPASADPSDGTAPAAAGAPDGASGAAGSTAAVAPPAFTVTTYVASGAGRSTVSAVQAAADQVAAQLGTTATVVDVAPLAKEDPLGTNLFYLLVFSSLAGYMIVIVAGQLMPGARLSVRYGLVGAAALLAPLVVFGLSAIFVGDYGASFSTITAVLGVAALYVLTVGAAAVLVQQFLGSQAQFGVMALIVFLNFPSAGGAAPASMMPPFWGGVHNVYFGSGAFEAFRSLVYFDGNGASRWILQLLAWLVVFVAAGVIVHLSQIVLEQRRRLAAQEPEQVQPDDGHEDGPALPVVATQEQRSLTAAAHPVPAV